jgi:hypothetical protein
MTEEKKIKEVIIKDKGKGKVDVSLIDVDLKRGFSARELLQVLRSIQVEFKKKQMEVGKPE